MFFQDSFHIVLVFLMCEVIDPAVHEMTRKYTKVHEMTRKYTRRQGCSRCPCDLPSMWGCHPSDTSMFSGPYAMSFALNLPQGLATHSLASNCSHGPMLPFGKISNFQNSQDSQILGYQNGIDSWELLEASREVTRACGAAQ